MMTMIEGKDETAMTVPSDWMLEGILTRAINRRFPTSLEHSLNRQNETMTALCQHPSPESERLLTYSTVQLIALHMDGTDLMALAGMVGRDQIRAFVTMWDEMHAARRTETSLMRRIETAKSAVWEATRDNDGCEAGKREFLESTGLFSDDEIDEMFERDYLVTVTYRVTATSEDAAYDEIPYSSDEIDYSVREDY